MNAPFFPKSQWPGQRSQLLVCFALLVFTVLIYAQAGTFKFLQAYDDLEYVVENPQVRQGITVEGVTWALHTFYAANWHPLTWISHMLDAALFGMDAGRHHLNSVWLHTLNVLLLFGVMKRMTASMWRSALVAALFAWHPLHVESVAMVAERKDVLCGFFWLLSIWCYIGYVRNPDSKRYVLLLCAFICGLMSKPMIVTLPFVLMLLDVWPLKRWGPQAPLSEGPVAARARRNALIREKLPLIGLSLAAAAITWIAQASEGAVQQAYPLGLRLLNALTSYGAYLAKIFWPDPLAVFYPYRESLSLWAVAASGTLIVAITLAAVLGLRRRPVLFVGWFWYLGTLVPVIGLVQVGAQAMADRYTYMPSIGIFIVVVWGVAEVAARNPARIRAGAAVAAAVLLLLMASSYRQVRLWSDDLTLFSHATAVTEDNWLAHNNLGIALSQAGQKEDALQQFRLAYNIKPNYADARFNLAVTLAELGRTEQALDEYRAVLQTDPHHSGALNNLGGLLIARGRIAQGALYCRRALLIDPTRADAHNNLGVALAAEGRLAEAAEQFRRALALDPDDAAARIALADLLARAGKVDAARTAYDRAAADAPRNGRILRKAADFFLEIGAPARAERLYGGAIRYGGDDPQLYNRIGAAAAAGSRTADAVIFFETVLGKDAGDAYARKNLEKARRILGGAK